MGVYEAAGAGGERLPQAEQTTLKADGTHPCTPVSQQGPRLLGTHWSETVLWGGKA